MIESTLQNIADAVKSLNQTLRDINCLDDINARVAHLEEITESITTDPPSRVGTEVVIYRTGAAPTQAIPPAGFVVEDNKFINSPPPVKRGRKPKAVAEPAPQGGGETPAAPPTPPTSEGGDETPASPPTPPASEPLPSEVTEKKAPKAVTTHEDLRAIAYQIIAKDDSPTRFKAWLTQNFGVKTLGNLLSAELDSAKVGLLNLLETNE